MVQNGKGNSFFDYMIIMIYDNYLCLLILQFFIPSTLKFLFFGLSRIESNLFENL